MFDAIHFTYYWVPCSHTFPELARLVAQLGFQEALGHPVRVCAPGEGLAPFTAEQLAAGLRTLRQDPASDLAAVEFAKSTRPRRQARKGAGKLAAAGAAPVPVPVPAAGS